MLRTDFFKTVDRDETRFIAVRDTITRANEIEQTDARDLDAKHCKQGRFGIGYHFLVLFDGAIQLCRNVNTCGNHSRDMDDRSVAIGVVGGADAEGERAHTRTPAQDATLADLVEFLRNLYPHAEVHDRPSA